MGGRKQFKIKTRGGWGGGEVYEAVFGEGKYKELIMKKYVDLIVEKTKNFYGEHPFLLGYLIGFLLGFLICYQIFNFIISNILFWLPPLNSEVFKNPPIFFSIGEMLTSAAILFSIYQYKKTKFDILFKIKTTFKRWLVVLMLSSFLTSFFSSLTPMLFAEPSFIWFSVTWQVISAIILVFTGIYFFYGGKSKIYNKQTCNNFFKFIKNEISYQSIEGVNVIIDVIKENYEIIIDQVVNIKQQPISEYEKISCSVISDLIGSQICVQYIATKRFDFLQSIMSSFKSKGFGSEPLRNLIGILLKELCTNQDSYFYKELDGFGAENFQTTSLNYFFNNKNILECFDPLGLINPIKYSYEINSKSLKLFLKAFEISLKNYFSQPEEGWGFEYSTFDKAFNKLEDVFKSLVHGFSDKKAKGNFYSDENFDKIIWFVQHTFKSIYREAVKDKKISKNDLDATVQENASGSIVAKSITAGYARLIFNFLCQISTYVEKESIFHYSHIIENGILLFPDQEFLKIRDVLLKYIWNKIRSKKYASDISGSYPVILPAFLSLTGMPQESLYNEDKRKLLIFLNDELKPLFKNNKYMKDHRLMEEVLLPQEVYFDKEKDVFMWKMSGGAEEEIKIKQL